MFRAGFARCPLDGTPLQQIVEDPLAGSIFADRYVIEGLIGEGGMGRVYRARHRRMSRKFAIKVLFGDHATDPKMRERFGREAEAASRLSHPNVISVTDFGETEEGLLYLAMEYVEGRELADVIDREAPLAAPRIRRMLRQLCLGLGHAHDQGLVHRDFKAANVIVAGEGGAEVCKIVDFGIAVLSEGDGSSRLTTEGIVLGTPAYMSPEQATGQELDLRSDLFSLGVLLYELLAGVLPFEGPPVAIARQNLASEPPRIRDRVPGLEVDPDLEAIAHRLMAKKREQRYQTAAAVIEALDRAAETPAVTPPPAPIVAVPYGPDVDPRGPTATQPPSGPVGVPEAQVTTQRVSAPRRTLLLAGIGVALLVVLAGGYLLTRGSGGDEKQDLVAADQPPPAAPDGATPATSATDAGPIVADVPLDAPETLPPLAGGGQGGGPRPSIRKKPPRDAGSPHTEPKPPTPPADAAPAPPAPIAADDLQKLYVSVGAAVDRLERQKGTATALPYRERYLRIPFSDALRTPALRRDVEATLKKLRADVGKQLQ